MTHPDQIAAGRPELVPTVKGNKLHVPTFACGFCGSPSQQVGSAYLQVCGRRLHICANCKARRARQAAARANPPEVA